MAATKKKKRGKTKTRAARGTIRGTKAENVPFVPSAKELSAEIRNILALTKDEEKALSEGHKHARYMYALGVPLKRIAAEQDGTSGCSYSTLRKLSGRFGWSGLRKRVKDARAKTAEEIVAEKAARKTVEEAEATEIPPIGETPETIQARHFHLATRVLLAVERSLKHYKDGLAVERESVDEEKQATTGAIDRKDKDEKKKRGKTGETKRRTREKAYDAHTVGNLERLGRVASLAMKERRVAAGMEDDSAPPAGNPLDLAARQLFDDLAKLDDDDLKDFVGRELLEAEE